MKDQFEIILEALINRRGYMTEYLKKEAGKFEYGTDAFFQECMKVFNILENDIIRKKNMDKHDLNELYIVSKDKKYIEQMKEISNFDYSVSLSDLTNGKYNGAISYFDLHDFLEAISQAQSNSSRQDFSELSKAFKEISKYKKVMEILVEKGYCQPNTYIWKDKNKGYRGLIAAIIKHLHNQGYLKRDPTKDEIILCAKNTFGIVLRTDNTKKAKPDNFDLKFIPPESVI